jgi:D-3-phosphoglycerate dehydrogenase
MQHGLEYRVFVTGSGIAREAQQWLKDENCLYAVGSPNDSSEDIASRLETFNPDALIVRQGDIGEQVIGAAPNLRVVCKHGVGTDNIDVEAATRAGIPVFYTRNANFESVATHTFALMLALIRQIPDQDKRIRKGVFDKGTYGGRELAGATLGIVGFGKVGRRLAELVAPFRMKVITYHPSNTTEALPGHVHKTGNVEEVLTQADIISLHCPLTPKTHHLLNRETFDSMKQGAYLINTARGGLVNESDLLAALEQNHIAGAALDVFENEPPANDHPLFQRDDVIVTTHIAGSSDNSLKNMGLEAVKHVLSVLKGEAVDSDAMKNKDVLIGDSASRHGESR